MRILISTDGKVTTIDLPEGSALEVVETASGRRLRYVEEDLVSGTLRDQLHLHRRVMRLIAIVVTALLVAVFAILGFFDAERMSTLWTSPLGRVLLVAAGSLTAVYHWAIRRLEHIHRVQFGHVVDSAVLRQKIAAHERQVLILSAAFGLVVLALLGAAGAGIFGR